MTSPLRNSARVRRSSGFPASTLLLGVLGLLLVAAIACGTDREGDGVGAASFQVEGDSLTWAPPWDEGDSRSVTITTSTEFSPALQAEFDATKSRGGGLTEMPGLADGTFQAGVVNIISTGSGGSTGEFQVSMEDLTRQMESQTLEQPGFGQADLSQLTSLMTFAERLDLGVEFDIGSDGTLGEVTNLEELGETISELFDSLSRLAALGGEDLSEDPDFAQMQSALDELPGTEAARVGADLALNLATSHLFLMRSGEYAVGEPVVVSGRAPSAFGMATDGTLSYELTGMSDGAATVEVTVSPGQIDLLAMAERLGSELAAIAGEDENSVADAIADMDPDERRAAELLMEVAFSPYRVTLTLDTETGWVTAADWSVELALPDGFEDLVPDDDPDLQGMDLSAFTVTIDASAVFEELTE